MNGEDSSEKKRRGDLGSTTDENYSKKQRRQERNREAARNCRQKKKKQAHDLEARVQQLEAELAQARAASAQGAPSRQQIAQSRMSYASQLRELLAKEGATDSAAMQVLANILRIAAGVGPAVDHHLTSLLELLEPFPYTKFLMWGIGCSESFFTPDAQGRPQGLFALLQKELQLSPEQEEKIKGMREGMKAQVRTYMLLLESLKKLQDDIRQYLAMHSANIGELRKMMSPVAQGRFLLWAEANDTCIGLVEQMWQQSTSALLAELRAPPPDFGFDFPLLMGEPPL